MVINQSCRKWMLAIVLMILIVASADWLEYYFRRQNKAAEKHKSHANQELSSSSVTP